MDVAQSLYYMQISRAYVQHLHVCMALHAHVVTYIHFVLGVLYFVLAGFLHWLAPGGCGQDAELLHAHTYTHVYATWISFMLLHTLNLYTLDRRLE
jgi:hypothetical protein